MNHDRTTYKSRKEREVGMTADHPSRHDKILFFLDSHFMFFFHHTNGTLPFAQHTSQRFAKVKEPFLSNAHKKERITSINF